MSKPSPEPSPETSPAGTVGARRPIKTRSAAWARALASRLARSSITADQISVSSMVFAALAGGAILAGASTPWAWLVAALCVQLRLIANLLDGMVAIEGGKKSAVGAIYNEVPDRVSDTLVLVPLGMVAGSLALGLAAALSAMMTAYVRTFGGSLGQPQSFLGPMSKSHRMAAVTVGLVVELVRSLSGFALAGHEAPVLELVAWSVVVLGVVTSLRRLAVIHRLLREEHGLPPRAGSPPEGDDVR